MIKFSEAAKCKLKEFMQASKVQPVALRVAITAKNEKGFTYRFDLEPWDKERPSDTVVREGGFATRMDPETARYMRGATIDWSVAEGSAGFAVQNPNPPVPPTNPSGLQAAILDAIRTIYDPEIPMVNIHDLGLIYNVDIDPERNVTVKMTLTAANCPAAEQLPPEVQMKVKAVPGVKDAKVELTFEPPWDKEMMSEAAKLALGL